MPVVLYERQRQVLEFISQYIQKHGYAPHLKDIAKALDLSSLATVHEHISNLEDKGILKKQGKGKERAIEIVDDVLGKVEEGVKLPILGYFEEGQPIQAYPKANVFYNVPVKMAKSKRRCFILEVKGDNLIDDGLIDNDLLILEEETDVDKGDAVIAILEDNKAYFRKIYQETTRVKLERVKKDAKPDYVHEVSIQGRVMGLIRDY